VSFVRAASVGEVWEGELRSVVVEGARILLVNVGGRVCAYEDRCAHQGYPLSEGRLEGGVLVCALHGWQYDPTSGCGVNPEGANLRVCPVKVEGGDVLISVDAIRPRPTQKDAVGPVLHAGPRAAAVVEAIRTLNPEATVTDRGAYLRVTSSKRLRVTRAAIEAHAGAPFALPADLERIMVSFKGRFDVSEDEAVWWSP
jgi:toluene monooxygenase system ferredoxin subunit